MDSDVAILGLGNIGLSLARILIERGYSVIGLDINEERLGELSRLGGIPYKTDLNKIESYSGLIMRSRVVATALPGSIAYKILQKLAGLEGLNIVDVSFFPESADKLNDIAVKNGSMFILDCGIAPGLSNFLLKKLSNLDEQSKGYIYVGGISSEPIEPLGYVATWNISDFIDEYVRPARILKNGKVVMVDPLGDMVGYRVYDGIGKLEYFPTDGLRSLLKSFKHFKELIEFTLRWPGHIDKMRFLRSIGLLSDNVIKGCGRCTARNVLEALLIKNLPKARDMVILDVEVGDGDMRRYLSVIHPREGFTAMSLSTAGFQYVVIDALLKGLIPFKKGVYYPEDIPADLFERFKNELYSIGIEIKEMKS